MSIRSWLGLCEHHWKPTGSMIEIQRVYASDPSKHWRVGFEDVRECSKCGAVKAFKL